MQIYIIPGFLGHPAEKIFIKLVAELSALGHTVNIIAWPYFPEDLNKYGFTTMLAHCRNILKGINLEKTIILGFSMGGIIATYLAGEFKFKKLGLIVSPYQAGTKDDLEEKYYDWKQTGFRKVTSSVYGELQIPFSFIEDARKYNALDEIPKVTCQILFVAGENDKNVPYKVSQKLYNQAKTTKEWHLITGMEHRYQYQSLNMIDTVNKLIIKFIET